MILLLVLAGCDALGLAEEEVVEEPEPEVPTAGNADVVNVFAREDPDGTWTFHVTVKHQDEGWDDYANGWDLVLDDGTVLKADPGDRFTKVLRHPHVDEQPFTRTQKGLVIPEGVTSLRVRAHDKRHEFHTLDETIELRELWRRTHFPCHGWGGEEVGVDLSRRFGEKYSVQRPL